jgi:hypothetical protein
LHSHVRLSYPTTWALSRRVSRSLLSRSHKLLTSSSHVSFKAGLVVLGRFDHCILTTCEGCLSLLTNSLSHCQSDNSSTASNFCNINPFAASTFALPLATVPLPRFPLSRLFYCLYYFCCVGSLTTSVSCYVSYYAWSSPALNSSPRRVFRCSDSFTAFILLLPRLLYHATSSLPLSLRLFYCLVFYYCIDFYTASTLLLLRLFYCPDSATFQTWSFFSLRHSTLAMSPLSMDKMFLLHLTRRNVAESPSSRHPSPIKEQTTPSQSYAQVALGKITTRESTVNAS